jgi:hypothetical protein
MLDLAKQKQFQELQQVLSQYEVEVRHRISSLEAEHQALEERTAAQATAKTKLQRERVLAVNKQQRKRSAQIRDLEDKVCAARPDNVFTVLIYR